MSDIDQSEHNQASIVRNSSFLSLNILVSRVTGLVREMVKAALLGTTGISDAFTVAFMIPNFMRRLFAEGSMSAAFIPTLKGYLVEGDRKETERFISSTFTALAIIVTATVALGIAATPLFVPLFGTEPVETTVLTQVMFPFLALTSLAALLQGMLNSVDVFLPSSTTTIWFNLIVVACAYGLTPFMPNAGRAMAIGVIIGGTFQAAYQLPFVLKRGFRFGFTNPSLAFRNPGTRKVFRLIGPTIIGMAAYQVNDLVSTALAGNAGTGVVSSLQFSLRLQELILGVFAVSIGTVMLPGLSAAAKRKEWKDYNDQFGLSLKVIALITIPTTFFSLTQGKEIVSLLFRARQFSDNSVTLTTGAFTFHIMGLYAIAMNRIIAPAFYAQEDTKSPTWAGISSFAVNIAFALALVGPMKGNGIALALSIASVANMVILLAMLKRNRNVEYGRTVGTSLAYAGKMAVFSVAAAVPTLLLKPWIYAPFAGYNRVIAFGVPLLASFAVFALVGVGLLAVTKDTQLGFLVRMLKRKTGKKG
jgi:putative peptidoglycan lipid II flippase